MPPLSLPSAVVATALESSVAGTILPPLTTRSTANGSQVFQVICAWPVSGQYGPGSRILYYVLVVACVVGRSFVWLRSACLAAALLVPAVAALHGIVLAALHVEGAVDMDVYGAFQLCAIGILAGPVTVKLSQTYFNAPGRNLIFLWTGMILAGLVSLTVEFFRASTVPCQADEFAWGEDDACGLTCSVEHGPFSTLRTGAQNNIYVITAPEMLSFGAATLLAAACCIPAILSLITMWNKILQQNWRKRFGDGNESEDLNQPISGTNAATPAKMLKVNDRIRFYLKMVEIPVFGLAILAITIVGEKNFFDYSVSYMTEPIASVGQWAPIVGTGLAALGSLYALLDKNLDKDAEEDTPSSDAGDHRCSCSHRRLSNDNNSAKPPSHTENEEQTSPDEHDSDQERMELSQQDTYQTYQSTATHHPTKQLTHTSTSNSKATFGESHHLNRLTTAEIERNSRHKVAKTFEWIGDKLGTPAPDAFDDSVFQSGPAADFPEVPGENERNPELHRTKASYNQLRDVEGNTTPLRRQRSQTGSFVSAISEKGLGIEGLSEANLHTADTVIGPSVSSNKRPNERRSTLEVPKPAYQSPAQRRFTSPESASTSQSPRSPTIRVSESQT